MFLRSVLSFDVWGDSEYSPAHLPTVHRVHRVQCRYVTLFMYTVQVGKVLCVHDEGEASLYSASEALCV